MGKPVLTQSLRKRAGGGRENDSDLARRRQPTK
jgi:hypothetical protein